MPAAKKILVALSGGVDSAFAAWLLQQEGHEVSAAYMRTWMNESGGAIFEDCPWEEDIRHAEAVCLQLGIPFEVVSLIEDYREKVVHYLVDGYRRGITPNPDIMCNREMKFGVFRDYAQKAGFDGLATGHYARLRPNPQGGIDICEGVDKNKDQSYFLAMVPQAPLQMAYFPVGEKTKPEVRSIARRLQLPNAERKDSQGICFLGKVRIAEFLAHYIPDSPGDIVRPDGTVLGKHKGLHRYTLGQRRGIGVPSNTDHQNYVVVAKDYPQNKLVVAFDQPDAPGLYCQEFELDGLSWVNHPITEPCPLLARPRYRDPALPVDFEPLGGGRARIRFREPQRALAAGQVVALYLGEILCGGAYYQ